MPVRLLLPVCLQVAVDDIVPEDLAQTGEDFQRGRFESCLDLRRNGADHIHAVIQGKLPVLSVLGLIVADLQVSFILKHLCQRRPGLFVQTAPRAGAGCDDRIGRDPPKVSEIFLDLVEHVVGNGEAVQFHCVELSMLGSGW